MIFSSDILKIRDSIIYNKNAKKDIKIASVSDIHISNIVGKKDINNISETLFSENPNYICILGDIIDSLDVIKKEDKIKELFELINNCKDIAPTLIILGGHDFIIKKDGKIIDVFDNNKIWNEIAKVNNVYLLNDEYFLDKNIFIGGYRQKKDVYYSERKIENAKKYYQDFSKQLKLIKNIPLDKPKVLLTHSPEPIHEKININLLKNYDIILTGHYHNGCVPAFLDDIWKPKNGGIISPKKRFFPKYARGIIKLETGTYLIYNGGWVKLQDCAPKILWPLDKLCNRQIDITTITPSLESEIEISSRKKVLKLK